jgi:Mg/Co/Ni transporter MgtE
VEAALQLLQTFLSEHPFEAALALELAPPAEAGAILADQPPDTAVEVWRRMAIPAAAAALRGMEIPSAVALLCRVPAGRAVLLLRRQSTPLALTLISACPDPWRTAIEHARSRGVYSVGAFMHPSPAALPADWTARQTGDFLIRHPEFLAFDLFVVDRDWRLAGRTDLLRLATTPGNHTLGGLIDPNPARLPISAPVASVREDPVWRTADVLPVTDESGLLVGTLAHKTLRSLNDEVSEEATPVGSLLMDGAELAWTGFAGAIDAAAILTHAMPSLQDREAAS